MVGIGRHRPGLRIERHWIVLIEDVFERAHERYVKPIETIGRLVAVVPVLVPAPARRENDVAYLIGVFSPSTVAAVGLLEIRGYNVLLSYHQIAHSWWTGFALPTKNSSRRVSCRRLARCCNFG
jgi:hypothetical protein